MAVGTGRIAAPVAPSPSAMGSLRPVGLDGVRLADGFWADRLRINRERTIPHGYMQLQAAGTLHNFRLAAGTASGRYEALGVMFDQPFPFLDSDVYKWLEAVGWELGRGWDEDLARRADEAIDLVESAQRDDGYVNTFVQVLAGGRAYADLAWGHELYCFGHLIQAAIAWYRSLGDDRLLTIAMRAAANVDEALGPTGRRGIDGHPEIEMALVELYRTTGESRWLDLATHLLEGRGHGLLGGGRFGPEYWQDHVPVRLAPGVAGHAVRQLYLDCGAVDVAIERGDRDLLDAVVRRWRDMVATRTYLTGGLGSRHRDESFGDPFELPPDRAYAETCAAIASVMLAWRLLLATGEAECADLIERTIYNGVLPGVGLDGASFFYVNPLQRRTHRVGEGPGSGSRAPWFACACCPPNLMRTFSSWPGYLVTTDDDGLTIHQYATGEFRARVDGSEVRLVITTDYPWGGRVTVAVAEAPDVPLRLRLRVPGWAETALVRAPEEDESLVASGARTVERTRIWRRGDRFELGLPMAPRIVTADPRIDAVRGCLAFERGPLVYCVESADLPSAVELEEIRAGPAATEVVDRADLSPGTVGLRLTASRRSPESRPWPYASAGELGAEVARPAQLIGVEAIPYFAWANRTPPAMRVWIPADEPAASTS